MPLEQFACLRVCVSVLYVTARLGPSKGVTVTRCLPTACEQPLTWGLLFTLLPPRLQVFGLEEEGLSGGEERGTLLSLRTHIAYFCLCTSLCLKAL